SSSARSPFSLSYRLLVGVRFFGSFPIQMQAIILGWQMYQFTRNPLDLGLIGLVEATPAIGLALFAGYFVDRTNPRLVILGVLFVSALSLFLAAIAKSPNELFLAALLTGIARSFYSPSIQSLIPRLVPRMAINRAIAASNSAMKLAYVSGPAAGGLLLGWVGATGAYSIGGLFFLTAFIAVFLIKYEHSRFVMPSRNEKRFLDELLAG